MTYKALYTLSSAYVSDLISCHPLPQSAPAPLPLLLQLAAQVTEEFFGGGLIGPAFKALCISKVKKCLLRVEWVWWRLEWTVSVRNGEAISAFQKLRGKVSPYIRRLETVLKSVVEGTINQVPRTGGSWGYSLRKAIIRAPITSTENSSIKTDARGEERRRQRPESVEKATPEHLRWLTPEPPEKELETSSKTISNSGP